MTDQSNNGPIPSATILLGRDGREGLEIFMVVRHHEIDFASGALVFPGGKVDPNDMSKEVRALCHGVDGLSDAELGFRVAAIREAYEESGILLARKKESHEIIAGNELKKLDHYRHELSDNNISISDFLINCDLVLACDLLTLYAHWITPEVMPKRFDTLFFIAKAPGDHLGVHDGNESVDSVWITPQKALADARSGKKTIIFPTRMNISKLNKYSTIDEAVASVGTEDIFTVMPVVENRDGDLFLLIPEEAGYGITEEAISEIKGNPKPL